MFADEGRLRGIGERNLRFGKKRRKMGIVGVWRAKEIPQDDIWEREGGKRGGDVKAYSSRSGLGKPKKMAEDFETKEKESGRKGEIGTK